MKLRPLFLFAVLSATCARHEAAPARPAAATVGAGDPARGPQLITRYGCNSCHIIPGIAGPKGTVGPSLEHLAGHPIIGNHLANTPENVALWLQNPIAIDRDSSMPNLGITVPESRDLAAFLATLR